MAARKKALYSEIDAYIERLFQSRDRALAQTLKDSDKAGLPKISVSPNLGRILYLLARIANAKRILEVGLLGGYSTIWLARAVPEDGKVISLELEEKHAEVAARNLERAGVGSKVSIRLGPALDSLNAMTKAHEAPFDVVFIDADKSSYPAYLERVLKLTRSGSLIIADNVIRNGRVLEKSKDPDLVAIQKFNRLLAANPKLEGILLPIVRENIDGLAIARVK